jgi:thiamine pyrophosphate-dependent acetolactate synthase large subunit-like protein
MKLNGDCVKRELAVQELLAGRSEELVVIGLGSPVWDCTAIEDHALNFPLWGAMGSAAMIGLGLALAQPKRRVLIITGDGEMLMGLGSLATIAAQKPRNLAIAVLDNEMYGETGGQRTHTSFGVRLAEMARGAGFERPITAIDEESLTRAVQLVRFEAGSVLVNIKVSQDPSPLVMPPREGVVLKNRFREALLGPDALKE